MKSPVGGILTELGLRDRVQAEIFAYGVGMCGRHRPARGSGALAERPFRGRNTSSDRLRPV